MPPNPTPEQLALRGFIKRIEEDPGDTEAWLGYGKLLAAKRDVRAESIQRWHEKRDFDAFITERAKDLFAENASDVGPDRLFRPTWNMGFVEGLTVCVPRGDDRKKVQARLSGLLKQPVFLLMREFRVELIGGGSTLDYVNQIRPTSIHNIRTIGFAAVNEGADRWPTDLDVEYQNFSSGKLDNAKYGGAAEEPFGPSRLQRIELTGRFRIPRWSNVGWLLPKQVRELMLENDNFLPDDVSALATWSLPALERLELSFVGKLSYGTPEDLDRLFGAPWPALRVLELRGCRFVDDLVEALVKSPLLDRLSELDLRLTDLQEAHVKALAERAPQLTLRVASPA